MVQVHSDVDPVGNLPILHLDLSVIVLPDGTAHYVSNAVLRDVPLPLLVGLLG